MTEYQYTMLHKDMQTLIRMYEKQIELTQIFLNKCKSPCNQQNSSCTTNNTEEHKDDEN